MSIFVFPSSIIKDNEENVTELDSKLTSDDAS